MKQSRTLKQENKVLKRAFKEMSQFFAQVQEKDDKFE